MGKVIPQRKRLAAIFASLTVLIMGTASLIESMAIDYYTVLNTLEKIIPASIIIGSLGWVMGMILDKPKRKTRTSAKGYNRLFLNKIAKSAPPEIKKVESIESIDAIENIENIEKEEIPNE